GNGGDGGKPRGSVQRNWHCSSFLDVVQRPVRAWPQQRHRGQEVPRRAYELAVGDAQEVRNSRKAVGIALTPSITLRRVAVSSPGRNSSETASVMPPKRAAMASGSLS